MGQGRFQKLLQASPVGAPSRRNEMPNDRHVWANGLASRRGWSGSVVREPDMGGDHAELGDAGSLGLRRLGPWYLVCPDIDANVRRPGRCGAPRRGSMGRHFPRQAPAIRRLMRVICDAGEWIDAEPQGVSIDLATRIAVAPLRR